MKINKKKHQYSKQIYIISYSWLQAWVFWWGTIAILWRRGSGLLCRWFSRRRNGHQIFSTVQRWEESSKHTHRNHNNVICQWTNSQGAPWLVLEPMRWTSPDALWSTVPCCDTADQSASGNIQRIGTNPRQGLCEFVHNPLNHIAIGHIFL